MTSAITWEAPDGDHPARRASRRPMAATNGPCCANIASITMSLGDGGAIMTVDCVVIYTVDDDGLITSIRAHWEPARAMATLTR